MNGQTSMVCLYKRILFSHKKEYISLKLAWRSLSLGPAPLLTGLHSVITLPRLPVPSGTVWVGAGGIRPETHSSLSPRFWAPFTVFTKEKKN